MEPEDYTIPDEDVLSAEAQIRVVPSKYAIYAVLRDKIRRNKVSELPKYMLDSSISIEKRIKRMRKDLKKRAKDAIKEHGAEIKTKKPPLRLSKYFIDFSPLFEMTFEELAAVPMGTFKPRVYLRDSPEGVKACARTKQAISNANSKIWQKAETGPETGPEAGPEAESPKSPVSSENDSQPEKDLISILEDTVAKMDIGELELTDDDISVLRKVVECLSI